MFVNSWCDISKPKVQRNNLLQKWKNKAQEKLVIEKKYIQSFCAIEYRAHASCYNPDGRFEHELLPITSPTSTVDGDAIVTVTPPTILACVLYVLSLSKSALHRSVSLRYLHCPFPMLMHWRETNRNCNRDGKNDNKPFPFPLRVSHARAVPARATNGSETDQGKPLMHATLQR